MLRTYLTIAIITAGVTTPVLAATEYYVAKDAKANKCSVMDKKPDGKTMMDVGSKAYVSQANATDAMSKLKDCK